MQDVIANMADAQKLASVGRLVTGTLALQNSNRLQGLIVDNGGSVNYRLQFGVDAVQRPVVHMNLQGTARLLCQRSLEPFDYPIQSEIKLAFIAEESDESSLFPDYDPVLLGQGELVFLDLVEDELILMMPTIAINPALLDDTASDAGKMWEAKTTTQSPFAQLSSLLKQAKN